MTRVEMKATDDEFFTRSQGGAIWGHLYFEIDGHSFPDSGWTDLVVAFSTAWLEALTRIAAGSKRQERVWFMDGPFAIDILASGRDVLKLSFLHRDTVRQWAETNLRDLLENSIAASKELLAKCQQRGWMNKDILDLSAAIQYGVEGLRHLRHLK